MELYLLRHAKAVPLDPRRFKTDAERPLTPEGEERMERLAEAMLALDLDFSLILSSPFPRARKTAEIVAKTFGIERRLKFTEHLAIPGNSAALIRSIADHYSHRRSILLVGHEPQLSELGGVLISGKPGVGLVMKKAGLAKLEIAKLTFGKCATLEWLLTPRLLEAGLRKD